LQPVSEAPIPTDRPPTSRFTNRICASEYEIQEQEGIAIAVAPDSTKLPIYHGIINDQTDSKTIIDSGATTIYIRDSLVKEQGFKITKIPPCTVIVANHDRIQVDGIVTVDLKLNGLPSERIAAYTFPLGNIDIILGLPWLKKHRPHPDWDRDAYEFTRNGRRYMLYPQSPDPPKIKIVKDPALNDPMVAKSAEILLVTAEEFNNFIDDMTHLYWIDVKHLSKEGRKSTHQKEDKPKPNKNPPRRLLRWIKHKCPELLREIGRPAKLEPFRIDTDHHPPIKINPRPYSPLDLIKIKEFIDENLKNGVISESDSPWSFPIVLAAKPGGGTRICVDYRSLNRITKKDAHPLPRIDESLLRFHGMKYFTHIDLRSGYWQIMLDYMSRQKTAFST